MGADRELPVLLVLQLDQPPYRALLGARVCTEYVCLRGGSGGEGVGGGQHKRRGVTGSRTPKASTQTMTLYLKRAITHHPKHECTHKYKNTAQPRTCAAGRTPLSLHTLPATPVSLATTSGCWTTAARVVPSQASQSPRVRPDRTRYGSHVRQAVTTGSSGGSGRSRATVSAKGALVKPSQRTATAQGVSGAQMSGSVKGAAACALLGSRSICSQVATAMGVSRAGTAGSNQSIGHH